MAVADRPATGSRAAGRSVPALVAGATVVAFAPILRNDFVNFDDFAMFHENVAYQGLGWRQVRWAFTTFHFGHYGPLTWLSYSLDYALWGLNPLGYHLTSLVLHVVTTLVLYGLAARLLRLARPDARTLDLRLAAGAAALAFGLHPLRVEPVAWASIRGTLLGGLFLLLCTWAYVAGAGRSGGGPLRGGWLAGAAALFGVSLLCRTSGLTLPLVLVLLDLYPLRRLSGPGRAWLEPPAGRLWREKVPFLLLAAAAVPVSFLARRVAVGDEGRPHDLASGVAQAAFGSVFYLGKTLVPLRLAPFYEMPEAVDLRRWPYLVSVAAVLAISGALVGLRRRYPGALVAWGVFGALLLPMSGLLPAGNLPLAADRYTYVACAGWAVLAGGAVLAAGTRGRRGEPGPARAGLVWVLAAAVLAWWGALSWQQAHVWRDGQILWHAATRATPFSGVAHHNLGSALERKGQLGLALPHYRVAARLRPDLPTVWMSLGRGLVGTGEPDEALDAFRKSIELAPGRPEAYIGLGYALFASGRADAALEQYRMALARDPGSALAHYNMGLALRRLGRTDEAVAHLEASIRGDERMVEARRELEAARHDRAAAVP